MSRKKIVAATMTAAALGLAFAGYTATRANGTDELPHARSLPLNADAGYRKNHQIGHDGAVFEWMDAAASLKHPNTKGHDELPVIGKDPVAAGTEDADDLEPVTLEHAGRIDADFRGFGLAAGGGGGTPKGGDEWAGGRYAGNFGGFGGIGSFGGGGGVYVQGASGTNDVSGDKPHQDAPSGSNSGPGGQPGTADPKAGDPPATGPHQDPPSGSNPPAQEQNQNPPRNEGSPGGPGNNPGDEHEGSGYPPGNQQPPGGAHSVPEPATLGLLGFGLIAAGALRRRRRS